MKIGAGRRLPLRRGVGVGRPTRDPGRDRLRRRLTIAFLLVAGLSAAALAVASYAIVREARLSDSVDRSVEQSRFNLVRQRDAHAEPERAGDPASCWPRTSAPRRLRDRRTRPGRARFSSSVSRRASRRVPAAPARASWRPGKLGYERVDGRRNALRGRRRPGEDRATPSSTTSTRRSGCWDELAQLRNVLLAALRSGRGHSVRARRRASWRGGSSRPVGRASQAAHSLAEGLARDPPAGRGPATKFGVCRPTSRATKMAEALGAKIRDALSREAPSPRAALPTHPTSRTSSAPLSRPSSNT